MAQFSIQQIYNGEKYNIKNSVLDDIVENAIDANYDAELWLHYLIVKHAILATEKMREEGDSVSGMTDAESSFNHVQESDEDDND